MNAIDKVEADANRSPRVPHKVVYDSIRTSPRAILTNLPQHVFRHGLDRSDTLDFCIRQPRVTQHRPRYNPVRVADKDHSSFPRPLYREHHPVLHTHQSDSLEDRNAVNGYESLFGYELAEYAFDVELFLGIRG